MAVEGPGEGPQAGRQRGSVPVHYNIHLVCDLLPEHLPNHRPEHILHGPRIRLRRQQQDLRLGLRMWATTRVYYQ